MLNFITFSHHHTLMQKFLRLLLALAALLFLALLYVAFVGVSIDASALRGNIANKFSESIGREVRFEGPLQLEISAHPKLRMGGLHIANAVGFEGGELASLREARLALDLWSLLLLRLQIEELAGSDVHLRLQLDKNGSNNWTFKPAGDKQEEAKNSIAESTPVSSVELGRVFALLDIRRVSLEKLSVEYITTDAKIHFFDLNSLVAQLPAGQPVSLILNGTVEKKYPYQLDFTGGMLADLTRTDKPWPIDISLNFMSSRLALNGSVLGNTGEIQFGLGTENLSEFDRLFQTKLPAVGSAGITGSVKYAPGKITLDNLNGIMGKTTLHGALSFDNSGLRPKIQGELTLPVLDLRPFMTEKPLVQEEPPQSLAEVYREFSKASFSMKALNSVDADLTVRVGQWLSLPGSVHDAKLQVKLAHGRLSVPVQATVADVILTGSASADATVSPARFKLALGTRNSKVGKLSGVSGVEGQLGRFDLRIAARGDRGAELMESLDVQLNVEHGKLTYGNDAGGNPVQFTLNNLLVTLPAGKLLRGEAHGSLLGKTFSAALHGGSLTDIMQGADVPIDFSLQAGSIKAQLHTLLRLSDENSVSKTTFKVSAPHSGEIASWLGLKPGSDVPISLQGDFHTDKDSWHLADFALQLGRSALSVDVLRTFENSKSLIIFNLTGDIIDVDELQSLLPEPKKENQAKENYAVAKPATAAMIDIPILPNGINLADADIVVRIKRIASTSPFAVRDLRFDGRIRDGTMSASPFAANVAETNFSGQISLDLRTQQPKAELLLTAESMDIGRVLNKLDIVKNFDAKIDRVRLHLDLHSSHLGQLLANSELALSFEGGHFTLHDANTGGALRIVLDNGEIKSAVGKEVRLDLNGTLANVPVAIAIQTAKAVDLLNPALSIPFKLNTDISGASLQLSGNINRPFTQKAVELALDMRGDRFDNLNSLLHVSLPPWGPWSASGKFRMSSGGYEVSSLRLKVGSSELNGQGRVDTKAVPPRIDVALAAPTIQLDDFKFGDWSPEKSKPPLAKTQSPDEVRKSDDATSNKAQQLLSREVMRRQNGNLTVRVEQVLSGTDILGSGKLEAQLKNGRANIGPVVVNTPGGSAMLQLAFEPGEKDVEFNFQTEIKRLDYGILARRIDKKSDMRGTFSLDVDVNARAQYMSELLRYGKGHINFAVWPENLKSGVFDMWAVNVLMALLPAIDASNKSKVNCAIGRFVLADGKLTDKKILIDTSRMRVTGKGEADFAAEKIQLYVKPHAKTPQFLSFAIPIELSGSFDDFHIGVRAADLLEEAGQLVTSVVWVPLQMLFGKTTPADGKDVCVDTAFK